MTFKIILNKSETYQVDWEAEAKKFQSMHDKQASENDKMRQDLKYMAEKFAEAQNNQLILVTNHSNR